MVAHGDVGDVRVLQHNLAPSPTKGDPKTGCLASPGSLLATQTLVTLLLPPPPPTETESAFRPGAFEQDAALAHPGHHSGEGRHVAWRPSTCAQKPRGQVT